MKAENEKEFLALIERYKSINLQRLQEEEDEYPRAWKVLSTITGFGNTTRCTLCCSVRKLELDGRLNCSLCVYGTDELLKVLTNPCIKGNNGQTFDAIIDADSLESLLVAIKNRAKHMKKVWKQYQKQI